MAFNAGRTRFLKSRRRGEIDMPDTSTIEDRLRQFVLKQFPLARKVGVTDETDWLQNGTIDSLGILDLVQFLENEFSVVISDEELAPENFRSLTRVADFVRRKTQSAVQG